MGAENSISSKRASSARPDESHQKCVRPNFGRQLTPHGSAALNRTSSRGGGEEQILGPSRRHSKRAFNPEPTLHDATSRRVRIDPGQRFGHRGDSAARNRQAGAWGYEATRRRLRYRVSRGVNNCGPRRCAIARVFGTRRQAERTVIRPRSGHPRDCRLSRPMRGPGVSAQLRRPPSRTAISGTRRLLPSAA